MLGEERYQANATRIRNLLMHYPVSAKERLVKYVELVSGSGEGRLPELQVEGRHLSMIVYFNLDIILPLILLVVLLSWRLSG